MLAGLLTLREVVTLVVVGKSQIGVGHYASELVTTAWSLWVGRCWFIDVD